MKGRLKPWFRLSTALVMLFVAAISSPEPALAFRGIDYWAISVDGEIAGATAVYDPYDYNESRYISNNGFACVGSETPSTMANGNFNTFCWFCCNNGSFITYIAFPMNNVPDPMPSPSEWDEWCITT